MADILQSTEPTNARRCVAFEGDRLIAAGTVPHVALAAKDAVEYARTSILCFDEATSEPIDLDLHGSREDVAARYASMVHENLDAPSQPTLHVANTSATDATVRGPGRPKLGVVAREVTLLPRHWEWLATQPGGASVALRRLVEDARRRNVAADARRLALESTYRFMMAMAGNRAGFEEATRALYAADSDRFRELVNDWPNDMRDHIVRLASQALAPNAE